MNKLSKNLILLVFLAFIIFPVIAIAASPLANLSDATPTEIKGNADIYPMIGTIIQVVLGFIGVLFLILVIYGGVTWMTAGGDSTKVQKAKDTIIKAIIGLIIILSSYIITTFLIKGILGIQ